MIYYFLKMRVQFIILNNEFQLVNLLIKMMYFKNFISFVSNLETTLIVVLYKI